MTLKTVILIMYELKNVLFFMLLVSLSSCPSVCMYVCVKDLLIVKLNERVF